MGDVLAHREQRLELPPGGAADQGEVSPPSPAVQQNKQTGLIHSSHGCPWRPSTISSPSFGCSPIALGPPDIVAPKAPPALEVRPPRPEQNRTIPTLAWQCLIPQDRAVPPGHSSLRSHWPWTRTLRSLPTAVPSSPVCISRGALSQEQDPALVSVQLHSLGGWLAVSLLQDSLQDISAFQGVSSSSQFSTSGENPHHIP